MKDDTRRQGKGEGLGRCSQVRGRRRLFLRAGIMLSAVAILSVVSFSITQADEQPIPSKTINYQSGTITAIYEKTLDIDGRNYGVMPDVVMLDQHGEAIDPGRLIVSAEVKFHVKKEQSNIIDQMIVTLPF